MKSPLDIVDPATGELLIEAGEEVEVGKYHSTLVRVLLAGEYEYEEAYFSGRDDEYDVL